MSSLIASTQRRRPLVTDLLLPELDRQLGQDPSLWPNIKGNGVAPVITTNEQTARKETRGKVQRVKIQVEDSDALNFITGGLTGIKAYTARRIRVRGNLELAQSLEQVFVKTGGRERAIDFIQRNEQLLNASNRSSL
ncbi:hypothetical protein BCR43DRAFT_26603 [Syncephalastrum racemosum]|uniref:SCP2 domain-containing protein n=1 Tax=Syncephalastrum racemosum TaxID=13706 RepID=A0A1X2HTE8_SYNRA|nr:hypothetical protein BCR43DRAFT_26603 [Syncephalastrum racemosum]